MESINKNRIKNLFEKYSYKTFSKNKIFKSTYKKPLKPDKNQNINYVRISWYRTTKVEKDSYHSNKQKSKQTIWNKTKTKLLS